MKRPEKYAYRNAVDERARLALMGRSALASLQDAFDFIARRLIVPEGLMRDRGRDD